MTYPRGTTEDPRNDTPQASPLDEFEPHRGRSFWLGMALLVTAGVLAFWLAVRFWRALLGLLAGMFGGRGGEVTYGPLPTADGAPQDGPGEVRRYRLRFYDGEYPQLTDVTMHMMINLSLPEEKINAQLEHRALALRNQVESRDSQRCFAPRIELRDSSDTVAWRWP